MYLTLNTAAAEPPVTLAEAKAHLRVDFSDDDTLIASIVDAATSAVEEETGRALVTQTWDYSIAAPTGDVCLPLAPVASVSAMVYRDADDVEQSLMVSDFYLFKDGDRAIVRPKSDVQWPGMKSRPDALKVTFVVGQAVADVPQALKHAVLLLVGHWYEAREGLGDVSEAPLAYRYLTAQHKLGWAA